MLLNPGDHICAIYANDDEVADTVSGFLAEGLRKSDAIEQALNDGFSGFAPRPICRGHSISRAVRSAYAPNAFDDASVQPLRAVKPSAVTSNSSGSTRGRANSVARDGSLRKAARFSIERYGQRSSVRAESWSRR